MSEHDQAPFRADKIDEQIEQYLAATDNGVPDAAQQAVHSLQRLYAAPGTNVEALDRVWQRLSHLQSASPSLSNSARPEPLARVQAQPARRKRMDTTYQDRHSHSRRLSIVMAVAAAVVMVGSMLVLLQLLQQHGHNSAANHGQMPAIQPTKTLVPVVQKDDMYVVNNSIIYRFDAKTGQPLWHFPAHPDAAKVFTSDEVVINNVLYVFATDVDYSDGNLYAYAINTTDGSLQGGPYTIQKKSPSPVQGELPLVGNSKPMVVNGIVYASQVSVSQGYTIITAFSLLEGKQLWRQTYQGTGISNFGNFQAAGLVLQAVSNNVLYGTTYTGPTSTAKTTLWAIDARTDAVLWTKQVRTSAQPDYAGQVVDGTLCISASATNNQPRTLYGYDVSTGTQKWSIPLDGQVSNMIGVDGVLYAGTSHSQLDSNNNVISPKGSVYAIQASSGQTLWQYAARAGVTGIAMTAVDGNTIYAAASRQDDNQQTIVALNIQTGKERWSQVVQDINAAPNEMAFNPSIVADHNAVYIGRLNGHIQQLQATNGNPSVSLNVAIPGADPSGISSMITVSP